MKRSPGRPPITEGHKAKRVMVTLDPTAIDAGRKLGEGNLSLGIRRALSQATSGPLLDAAKNSSLPEPS